MSPFLPSRNVPLGPGAKIPRRGSGRRGPAVRWTLGGGCGAGRSAGPTSPQAGGALDAGLTVLAAPTELGLGLECQELAVALPLLSDVVALLAPRFLFGGEFRKEIGQRGVAPSTRVSGLGTIRNVSRRKCTTRLRVMVNFWGAVQRQLAELSGASAGRRCGGLHRVLGTSLSGCSAGGQIRLAATPWPAAGVAVCGGRVPRRRRTPFKSLTVSVSSPIIGRPFSVCRFCHSHRARPRHLLI